ncbi:MAG TPA: hypothetical protein LFW11_05595 [Rickettsia endosymbiont of Proechinophthirus fluctus]|uniref:hypothetical protein n=1 Tax=Rickettsia endosymbiont of Proechinophthirus fluctus TaxID=1462733 RepID=UPI000789CB70|nr:hypothetical protein [Rickettsia endosymbiont of Proechinophthirus fluctus]KYP98657.1 hypothetical protein BG75_01500 [Rickettsia endosymbiont of Proechinophthirus fluctus]HJD54789.1 hypothetical protein [Rickettsia endosymbiont of Proechinophthirus fluctus]
MPTYKNSKHISTKKLAYIGLDLAYKTDDLNIYKLKASKVHEQLTDSGWAILTASCDNINTAKYAYKAVAFINKDTKEVHIASAGTKFNIYDLLDDLLIALHYLPTKLTPIQDFVNEIINKLGGLSKATEYSFNTSGHSLGAIIADLTLVEIHSRNLHFNKSTTFDSPGSKPIIERGIEKNLFTGKVTTPIKELATHSKIYNAKHNLINITNKHFGQTTMVLPGKNTTLSQSEERASYLYNFAKQKVTKYLGINGIVEGFEEIIAGISKHGLVNFSDLKQNITLTIDDWEAVTPKYAKNTLNLKNNLYNQIVETETGANLVGMYNNFQSCSQEYAQEVQTTGDISNYHLYPLIC